MTALTGVVLAGGSSSRMGTDKALLVVRGTRLVDRAVATLHGCCDEVLVASGDRVIPDLDILQIPDAIADAGPLGGIRAAMAEAATPLVAVLAVDLPHASAPVFRALAERWQGEAVVLPVVAGRAQPLHAVWSTAAGPSLQELVEAGERRVMRAAAALGASLVEMEGDFSVNINTPDDLPGGLAGGHPDA